MAGKHCPVCAAAGEHCAICNAGPGATCSYLAHARHEARAEGASEERARIAAWHRSEATRLRREASLWSDQRARSPVARLEYAATVHESSSLRIEAHREPVK